MKFSLLDQVSELLRETTARTMLPRFRHLKPKDAQEKTDHKITHEQDWVLIVDTETESALTENLPKLLPGSVVLGEEGYAISPEIIDVLNQNKPVWIIDPLDGTTNFKNEKPYFGPLIALYQNGQVIASWTYHPLTDEMIVAEKGAGAWSDQTRLTVLKSSPEDLSVIFNTALPKGQREKLIVACSAHFSEAAVSPAAISAYDYPFLCMAQKHPEHESEKLPQKHAVLMYADRPMKPWDHAGGMLLVEESGGHVRTLDDDVPVLSRLDRGILAATDPESWRVVQEKIRLATLSL